jgi:predicted phosphodiesterase
VIRHESVSASTAPGVTPSEAIMAKHPYTVAIVGHTHEYRYAPQDREIIVGNGGAPLSGMSNYGYVVARQRQDGAIVFTSYDYMTNAAVQTFALKADGTAS